MVYKFKIQKYALNSNLTSVLMGVDERFFDAYYALDNHKRMKFNAEYIKLRTQLVPINSRLQKCKRLKAKNLIRYNIRKMNEKLTEIERFILLALLKN